METVNGKLQLVISSKKVLVRVERVEDSFMTWDGQVRVNRRRVKVYDYVFDDSQARALKEARELASKSGMELVVTDLTRRSALERFFRSGLNMIRAQARVRTVTAEKGTGPRSSDSLRPQACRP